MKTIYNTKRGAFESFRKYNEQTGEFEKWGQTVKFMGEEYRKQQQSIDLYNVLLWWIKNRGETSPEHFTICHILKERGETELLFSLLVNI